MAHRLDQVHEHKHGRDILLGDVELGLRLWAQSVALVGVVAIVAASHARHATHQTLHKVNHYREVLPCTWHRSEVILGACHCLRVTARFEKNERKTLDCCQIYLFKYTCHSIRVGPNQIVRTNVASA